MAEKVKIAEIDIDVDALLSKTAKTKKSIAELEQSQKALKKETDNLTSATKQQAEQFTQQDADLKSLRKEYRNGTDVLNAYTTVQQREINNVEDAREVNLALIKIKKKLNTEDADQAALLKRLNDEVDKNTDYIKENSSEYEKTKINVGNYKESIKEALGEMNLFGGEAQKVTQVFQQFGPVFSSLKQDFSESITLIRGNTEATQGMSTAQKAAAASTNLGTGALKLFRVALIATGIGAIVVLLGLLVGALSQSERFTDGLTKALAPLRGAFSAIIGVIQDVALNIGDLVDNSFGQMKDTFTITSNSILNQIDKVRVAFNTLTGDQEKVEELQAEITKRNEETEQAVQNTADRYQKLKGFVNDTVDRIREGANAQSRIVALGIEIENSENRLILSRSEILKQIKEQNKIAEDLTNSQIEREEAAKRSIELSKQLVTEEQSLLDLKIEQKTLENSINESSRADQKELNELVAQRNDKETQGLELQTTQQNKLNTIRQQINTQAQKAVDLALQQQQIELQIFQASQGFAVKSSEDQLKLAQDVFEKQKAIEQKKLDNKKITQKEFDLFVLQSQNELAKMQAEQAVEVAARELEIFKTSHERKVEQNEFFNEVLFNQELERLNRIADAEREFQTAQFEQGLINRQEFNDAIDEIDRNTQEQRDAAKAERDAAQKEKQAFERELERELEEERYVTRFELERAREEERYQAELAAAERLGADLTAVKEKNAQARQRIDEAEQDAKIAVTSAALGDIGKVLGESTKLGKAASLVSAAINTYEGITAALKLPFPANIAAAATTGATGFRAIQQIKGTSTPRAERGISIDIQGRSHSQGGETLYDQRGNPLVEAQGGEKMFILNRGASAEIAALSRLNQKHGGVALSKQVTYANNGGSVAFRNPATLSNNFEINYDAIGQAVGLVVSEKVNSVQVAVPVDRVVDIATRTARVEQGANF